MSAVISCMPRGESAVFVFMIKIEVFVEFVFLDLFVVHDLEELFKLFDEVFTISRFMKFQGHIIEISNKRLQQKNLQHS